ncbi:MAG TPA: rhomboid family intramembrane serine protease [Flavobacterium sp.]|nr:rhomboid family intramembrane serine protease [Flavobacterium sp.]
MMQLTETVKHLILINILFFVGAQFVAESHALLPMYYFENPLFQFWQPLTSMFMHGSIGHILFNMFGLYMFGSTLEQYWGAKKFLFFYISCGLGAALVHQGVNYLEFQGAYTTLTENGLTPAEIKTLLKEGNSPSIQEAVNKLSGAYSVPVVGASGAIYGVLVAFAFMFPNVKLMLLFLPVPIAAKYFVPAILLIDLFSGLNGNSVFGVSTGIAHFAHLGGALTGFLIMWYWKRNQFRGNRWD